MVLLNEDNEKAVQRLKPDLFSHNFDQGHFGLIKIPPDFATADDFVQELLKHSILVRDGSLFEIPDTVRFHLMLEKKQFKTVFSKIMSFY